MRLLAILAALGSLAIGQTVDTAPRKLAAFTIAAGPTQLPAASSWTDRVAEVSDGASACDVTVGSGTTRVIVLSNGTSWTAPNCGGSGGSVFTGSTCPAPAFGATPTFSFADITVKSPTCFEPTVMTANVTAVVFTNPSAGARTSIKWLQAASGTKFSVTYGGTITNTCQVSQNYGYWTEQFIKIGSDGVTPIGDGCSTNDPADTSVVGPASSTTNAIPTYVDTTGKAIGTGIVPGAGVSAAMAIAANAAGGFCTNGGGGCAGSTSPFLDQQGPTGNITMTGSDVTIYTTTIAGGTMAAGKCLTMTIHYVSTASGIAEDVKLFYGSQSYTFRTGIATANQAEYFPIVRLCNNASVTNAQTVYFGLFNFSTANIFSVNSNLPVTGQFTVDSTASQALAIKANAASSTVSGQQWHVEVDR